MTLLFIYDIIISIKGALPGKERAMYTVTFTYYPNTVNMIAPQINLQGVGSMYSVQDNVRSNRMIV